MLREGMLIVPRTLRKQEKNGWELIRDLGSFSRVRGTPRPRGGGWRSGEGGEMKAAPVGAWRCGALLQVVVGLKQSPPAVTHPSLWDLAFEN